jgi:hypothetical protein
MENCKLQRTASPHSFRVRVSLGYVSRSGALTRLPLTTPFHPCGMIKCSVLLLLVTCTPALAQTRSYPKEIRGYKVERTAIEIKKPESKNGKSRASQPNQNTSNNEGQTEEQKVSESDVDTLIQFGQPQLARVTPLGITFKVPIVVAPVAQKGRVEFLMFEDMSVNGTSVEIDEYHRAFDLPNKKPSTLREPLSFYIYLPRAVIAAVDEWGNSKETWPVTGRVYVFGKFKKGPFSFKRCVPVELNVTMRNPLRAN